MRIRQIPFCYLKTTRGAKTPDFLVEVNGKKYALEIGGKGKGREQFKGISVDEKRILVHGVNTDGLRIPLHALGCI